MTSKNVLLFLFLFFFISTIIALKFSSTLAKRPASFSSSSKCLYSTSANKIPDSVPGYVMTLSRFMIEATRSNPDHGDFESLMESIQIACKTIANTLSKVNVNDLTGNRIESDFIDPNSHQNKLYETANQILKNSLRFSGKLGTLTSSEDDQPVLIEESWNSKLCAVFDPLDGSLNIDVGIVTGTIFSIYLENNECLTDFGENISDSAKKCLLETLQSSKKMVAAGYCMYSSSTVLMLTLGNGVHGFTLDPSIGEFILTHPNVKIPKRGRFYSFNEANEFKWSEGMQNYIKDIKRGKGELGLSYTGRYIGSLVGDLHRTLLYGGVFGYPEDSKRPQGKLRLLHEVRPLAFLCEQAGGKASTGYMPISEVVAESLHDRVSTLLGSSEDVTEAEKYIQKFNSNNNK